MGSPGGTVYCKARTRTDYQLLQTDWSAWQPGEQRRAMIALIPRVHQDLMVYIGVVLEPRRHHGPSGGARWCGFQSSAHPEPGGGWTVYCHRACLYGRMLSH